METPGPGVPRRPSVVDPVSRALDWTGHVLFRPFDIKKWFVLGFCAWLAWLGEKGGGGSSNWNLGKGDAWDEIERAQDWALANLAIVLWFVAIILVLTLVLGILFLWLSSRGKFMFLDGVVHNRGAVVEPWKRLRQPGNSLFVFRLLLMLAGLTLIVLAVGLIVAGVYGLGLDEEEPGAAGILALMVLISPVILIAFALALVVVAINDFVVPIMWIRNCGPVAAWREFLDLLTSWIGTFFLYILMKILIAVLMFGILCCATCLTCCIVAIPYLGTVITLPLFVFHRSYSMYFLSQFGPAYAPLAPASATPGGDSPLRGQSPPTPPPAATP